MLLCDDWSPTALLVPGVVCAEPLALGEEVAVPALGVWSSGRVVDAFGSGVALVAGGFSGVLLVLLGFATLPEDWLLVLDWPLVLLEVDGSCEDVLD